MNKELLDYFNNDELAANVWLGKYAQEEETSPDQMHKRLAKEFARIEYKYKESESKSKLENLSNYGKSLNKKLRVATPKEINDHIYELFKDFKWIIPQGSIMSNLGNKAVTSLSNCFVIGQPTDSYGGIFKKDEEMVQLMKRRGGVGIDLSTLRPAKTVVSNAAKTSTGMVSFMHRYSNSTREVAQDGRRGALMLSAHINHPDIMDFIKIKRDLSQVTGANISVKISEEFMKAVEDDDDYWLRFPCDNKKVIMWDTSWEYNKNYECLDEESQVVIAKRIKAKEYWNEIIKSAHSSAEPGIIFEDNHHNYSPDGVYPQFKGVTTNPCGEIFMQEYDACRLIAVNYFSFVDKPFTSEAKFDFEKFYKINYEAMRLSDDLIDLELEHIDRILRKIAEDPEPFEDRRIEFELWTKIKETATASRRTGLGFTALGDALAALGLKYDSDEGIEIIEKISRTKMESELDCTIDLSILRGTFTGWNKHLEFFNEDLGYNNTTPTQGNNTFYTSLLKEFPEQSKRMYEYGRRNVSWSTVAPTGTVSLMTQTTSGIEPLFSPYYFRRKKINPNDEGSRVDFTDQNGDKWQEFPVLHPKFKDWILITDPYFNFNITTKEELDILFTLSPYYKSTANDINWVKRVEIQSIIQKYITHSISSTINLPNSVTEDEVSEIYMESWKKGLKGITVYRDGSRSGVLITESTKDKPTFEYKDAVKRPRELDADVHHVTIKGVAYKILVGLLDNKPYEVFFDESENKISGRGIIFKKKRGNYFFKKDDITTDITSAMSDEQVAISRLVSTSLRHGTSIHFITEQLLKCEGDIFSFTKSLARVLKKYIPEGVKSTVTCNDCGSSNVIFQEGCQTCQDCGSSKCD